MLLGALGFHSSEVDDVRQRLADTEASLQLHVALAADLATQLEEQSSRQLLAHEEAASPRLPTRPLSDVGVASISSEAVLRAINGRAERALLRTVLSAWRSHADKARIYANMRQTLLPRCHLARTSEPPDMPAAATVAAPRAPTPPTSPAAPRPQHRT